MRCKCGRYLQGSMRICRECAVNAAVGFDTDHFSKVDETVEMNADDRQAWDKPATPHETTKRFNANKYQRIGTAEEIQAAVRAHQRRQFWRVFLLAFLITGVIGAIVLLAVITHFRR